MEKVALSDWIWRKMFFKRLARMRLAPSIPQETAARGAGILCGPIGLHRGHGGLRRRALLGA